MRALLVGLFGMGVLSGCSSILNVGESEFSCPGASQGGVACMSAREVYKATETTDHVKPTHKVNGERLAGGKNGSSLSDDDKDDGYGVVEAKSGENFEDDERLVPTVDKPVPLRSQSKVMRIWVGPWEDTDGDLHAPGMVFTEIEPRRWNIGDGLVRKSQAISPLSSSVAGQPGSALVASSEQAGGGDGARSEARAPGSRTGSGPKASPPSQQQQKGSSKPATSFSGSPVPAGSMTGAAGQ